MKEERKVKKANKIIPFKIENVNFIFSTFSDKSSYFTFIHRVGEDKEITKDSPLLMQFESKSESDCLSLRSEFHNLLKGFAYNVKDKKKIENQLVEKAKEKINVENSWFNPSFTYVPPVYNNDNKHNKGSGAPSTAYQKCLEVKPVIVLEILQEMGEIIVDNITHNTSGEFFWSYRLSNNPSKQFKTSVKSKQHLFSDPANLYNSMNDIFNDVKQQSKGYGKGSVGLISFLGDHGLFSHAFNHDQKDEKKERSIEYILSTIHPKVDEQYLANNRDMAKKYQAVSGVKIMNYPRRPFKNNKNIENVKKYLIEQRKLSSKLVNKIADEGLLYGGSFVYSAMTGNSKLKFYTDQFFFHLTNKEGNYTGSERLSLSMRMDYQKGQEVLKMDKVNTHPVKGNGFRLMSKNQNPSGTFIAEAVIDVLSAYELFKIAGLDPDSFNYISIQGCNNLNNFLAINAGFGFELNEYNRPFGEIFSVKFKETKEKISPAKIEHYKNNFNNYDYYFINTGNEKCQEILNKLSLASKVLGKDIKIINKKNREDYIDYKTYDSEKSMFMDETSFDEFFLANKISFDYDNESHKYKTMVINEKEEFNKLNVEQKQFIYSTLMTNFKSTNLMFGIDNDEAGLKYRSTINKMSTELGINVYDMYPDVIEGKSIQDPKVDVNDILRKYTSLKEIGKEEEALKVVEDYVKKLVPNLTLLKKNKINNKP